MLSMIQDMLLEVPVALTLKGTFHRCMDKRLVSLVKLVPLLQFYCNGTIPRLSKEDVLVWLTFYFHVHRT